MSNFFQYVAQVLSGAAVALTTNAEIAVLTTPAPDDRIAPANGVVLSGFVNVTAGTSTTAIVVKIRAGVGTGGAVLQSTSHTLAATNTANIPIEYFDQSGALPIGQYTVTCTQTSGSASGSAYGTVTITPAEIG